LLIAPGWVRTDLGGPQALLTIDESIPNVVNTIEAQQGQAGLQYLDYLVKRSLVTAWERSRRATRDPRRRLRPPHPACESSKAGPPEFQPGSA